jgi:hypothetical protein
LSDRNPACFTPVNLHRWKIDILTVTISGLASGVFLCDKSNKFSVLLPVAYIPQLAQSVTFLQRAKTERKSDQYCTERQPNNLRKWVWKNA